MICSIKKFLRAAVPLSVVFTAPVENVWAQPIGEQTPPGFDSSSQAYVAPDDALGIPLGAFRLAPSAEMSAAYDSNPLAVPDGRAEDSLLVAQTQLHLASDSSAFDLGGDVFFRARRFADARDQNTHEYGVSASMDAQINGHNEIGGRLFSQRRFESRTEIETPDFEPVSFYNESQADFVYQHIFNRLSLRALVSVRQLQYERSDQRYRDLFNGRGELRGAYDLRNGVSLLGMGYYSQNEYRFSSPSVASSQTVGALVGVGMEIPQIARFELAAGYFRRSLASQLGETSGVSMRGSAVLQFTPLTTLRADLMRQDAPTRIPGAFGKVRTVGSVDVNHAYSRNLDFYLRGRATIDEFDRIHRTDRTFIAELGAARRLSPRLAVAAEYHYASRSSISAAEAFTRHVIGVSIFARL